MSSDQVPSWISVTHGSAPILLLAPHAGRRHDVRVPGRHKVNDLLTAEVTRELAASCGASAIVNDHMDRNELDLNRLSQVRRDAPWLIDLLASMLADMVSHAGRAIVLVVHGWNVTQAACDVGVGLCEQGGNLVPVRAGTATVSERFIASHLRPLQETAGEAGIAVTIGSRYPGAHPNNLLQIFRTVLSREPDEPSCPVGDLCRQTCIEAAQLELAIPLRWPGSRRDRFLTVLTAMLTGDGLPARGRPPRPRAVLHAAGGRVTGRRGLQFVTDDLLVMTSIDGGETGAVAGRLVVCRDDNRLSLFTGEIADPTLAWTLPPLEFEVHPDGRARASYGGPLVTFPTLTPFADLECGLALSRLVESRIELMFQPDRSDDDPSGGERFGDIRGEVTVDGEAHRIATRGVATIMEMPPSSSLPSCRVTLPTSPWGAVMASTTHEERATWHSNGRFAGVLLGSIRPPGGPAVAVRVQCTMNLSAGAGSLVLEVDDSGRAPRIYGRLERLIPVRRPGREGTVIETTFAMVRIDDRAAGWIEVTVATAAPAARR